MIIWGRDDYAARLETYFNLLYPEEKIVSLTFPLEMEDTDDFSFPMTDERLRCVDPKEVVYAAFSLRAHSLAATMLQTAGFHKVVFYDGALDNKLKVKYFRKYFAQQGKSFEMVTETMPEHVPLNRNVRIYMAKSVVDKSINEDGLSVSKYVIPVHAGAALDDKFIADTRDDTGENISELNRQYSEMTVFYWMWKNTKDDYCGLCHYRRRWCNIEAIAEKLRVVDFDAILPLPTLARISIEGDFLPQKIPEVWMAMLNGIREHSPEYFPQVRDVFSGKLFYANNMCILSRATLDDLCEWMFPIVEIVRKNIGELDDSYYNRYGGFVTEWLISLYFIVNLKKWRIGYAEKMFLG